MGVSHKQLGFACEFLQRYPDALEHYKKEKDIQVNTYGSDNVIVAVSDMNIATVYFEQSKYEEALDFFNNCLHIRLKGLGKNHVQVADVYNNIAGVYYNAGLRAANQKSENPTVEVTHELMNTTNGSEGTSSNNGNEIDTKLVCFTDVECYNKAVEFYGKSLQIRIDKNGPKHLRTAVLYNNIAIVYEAMEDADNALKNYSSALDIYKLKRGEDSVDVAIMFNNIGNLHRKLLCKQNTALTYYNRSLRIFTDVLGDDHHHTKRTQSNIIMCKSHIKPRHRVLIHQIGEKKKKMRSVKSRVLGPLIKFATRGSVDKNTM